MSVYLLLDITMSWSPGIDRSIICCRFLVPESAILAVSAHHACQ